MAANLFRLHQVHTFLCVVALSFGGNRVQAAMPRVSIDVGPIVECRDVTPPEFAHAHPDEKLVEATVHLSVLLEAGQGEELEQLRLRIDSPERRLRVNDFHPRTLLESELAGDVEVCTSNDKTQSLNASVGGVISGEHGPIHAQASPAAGVGVTQVHGSKESFKRLSPKQLVVASGTVAGEHGVFFKWNRTSQVALEGSREVTCIFLVSREWRGDWIKINCEATGRHRNYLGEKVETCGRSELFVGLFLEGDMEARQAASDLANLQIATVGGNYASAAAISSKSSSDLLGIGSLWKCPKPRSASATATAIVTDSGRHDMPSALASLRQFSGR